MRCPRAAALALLVLVVLVPAPLRAQVTMGSTVYFAEGTTRPGFLEVIWFLNTSAGEIQVDLEYQFADGAPARSVALTIPARSVRAVMPSADPAVGSGRDISVVASSSSFFSAARTIDVDTPFDAIGRVTGTTASAGIGGAATEWNLAEGSTLPGFQQYLTIQNAEAEEAVVLITYGLEGRAGPTTTRRVPPRSRTTVNVNSPTEVGAGETGVAARVSSTVPVLVERPMYFGRDVVGTGLAQDGGHVAAGVPARQSWFFAEGNVLEGWAEFLTVYNPGTATETVTVDYILEDEPPRTKSYPVAPGARRTVQVYNGDPAEGVGRDATTAASKGVSMLVTSAGTVVAERPIYVDSLIGNTGLRDGHVAAGAPEALLCAEFAVAFTDAANESFLTLANPSSAPVDVRIGLYGDAVGSFERTVPARRRLTVDLASLAPGNVFGVDVIGMAGARVYVEEPIYFALAGSSGDVGASVLGPTGC